MSAENPQTIVTTSNQTALIAQPDNEAEWELSEELGFLDYDEMCELGLAEGTAILTQLSAALGDMGASLGRRTNEINLANSQLDTRSTQGMRSILNNSAEDIVRFVMLSKPLVFQTRARFEEAFDALKGSLSLRQGLPKNAENDTQLKNLYGSISQLVTAIDGADIMMTQMRASVSGIPKATGKLNKACKGMLLFVEDCFSMSGKLRSMSHNSLSMIDQLLR